MLKALLMSFFLFTFAVPGFAESTRQICTEEAAEAGIEDPEEVQFYVNECVSQMATEMESSGEAAADAEVEAEADKSEAEPPQTTEL